MENSGAKLAITFYGGEPLLNFKLMKAVIERSQAKRGNKEIVYIENAEVGSGLLIADKVVVPFNNTFPQDTELFRLMDTNPNSSKQKAPIKSL